VRDTIARQFDVDAKSIKYDIEPGTGGYRNGTIAFAAKKGKSIDLQKIQESLQATRLGKRTRSGVNYLDITAEGKVAVEGKEAVLEVSGTGQRFVLGDEPKAKRKEGTKAPYQRLKEALARGERVTSVTGRVQGWNGVWPATLKALAERAAKEKEGPPAKRATVLVVTGFQTAKE
jgi:hypothetical protein